MISSPDYIPYATQWIDDDDISAVISALKSEWLTQGPAIESFERKLAEYCNVKHAVAVSNATAGLHLACLALKLGPGDLMWTSPNSFVASANCARYCGADVDFVDIDSRTYNLSVTGLEHKLSASSTAGRLPKVVIPVHFAGQSAELAQIRELSIRYGFAVLEDAAHAIGGQYKDGPVGSCQFSDISVFSFHPVKIMTTGEGGAVTTNSDVLYSRLVQLRSHGITRDENAMRSRPDGPWYYEQLDLGWNYRMTDIQACLGQSQLAKVEHFVSRRTELADRYRQALQDLPLTLPWQHQDTKSAWHLYVVRLHTKAIRSTRREVFDYLRAKGIGVNVHFIPIHTQPYYCQQGFRVGQFPEAERYYTEAISLPMFPKLTNQQQDRVVDTLRMALLNVSDDFP